MENKNRYALRKIGKYVVSVAVSAIVLSGANVLVHAETIEEVDGNQAVELQEKNEATPLEVSDEAVSEPVAVPASNVIPKPEVKDGKVTIDGVEHDVTDKKYYLLNGNCKIKEKDFMTKD